MCYIDKMIIKEIRNNSVADEIGLIKGDNVLKCNGFNISDQFDIQYMNSLNKMKLLIERNGKKYKCYIEKEDDEDLGIEFGEIDFCTKLCKNNCIFCFVKQLPTTTRETMQQRDDDYRLSLLGGNFITLTNLSKEEFKKIATYRLSPLYVSVHATDDKVRNFMIGRTKHFNILKHLKFFQKHNISIHAQIVLVPKVNDGLVLDKTLKDLLKLDCIKSIGIVPVGVTKFREKKNLYKIFPVTKEVAEAVILTANKYNSIKKIVFPADEFYLIADIPTPNNDFYGDYDLYEDGVGIVTKFEYDFEYALNEIKDFDTDNQYHIATGVLAYDTIVKAVERIEHIANKKFITVHKIINNYFGNRITVTGLIVGSDLIEQLKGIKGKLVLSDVMIKPETDLFLDNTTIDDVEKALGVEIIISKNDGYSFIETFKKK